MYCCAHLLLLEPETRAAITCPRVALTAAPRCRRCSAAPESSRWASGSASTIDLWRVRCSWCCPSLDGMAVAEGRLPAVQARLEVLQGARSGSISWAGVEAGVARISAAARAGLTAMAAMRLDQSLCKCDSCGQAGVGVRRCSRCRQV